MGKVQAGPDRTWGLDLVVVDYLQLMAGKGTMYEVTTRNSRAMKNIAKDLNVPVIVLSQLHRIEDETTEPKLSDLRESGAIGQDADIFIFLWAGESKGVRNCKIAKQRNGPLGKFLIAFDEAQTRFFTCKQKQ